jgi:hypothetical protein
VKVRKTKPLKIVNLHFQDSSKRLALQVLEEKSSLIYAAEEEGIEEDES